MKKTKPDKNRLDNIVAETQQNKAVREQSYREQALKLYPWICGRCGREFTRSNLQELTVHHRDHNHDNNPPDGSNWELLCLYCHDNEHSRYVSAKFVDHAKPIQKHHPVSTHRPFADIKEKLIKRAETNTSKK